MSDPHADACGELIGALSTLIRLNRVIGADVARRAGLAPSQAALLDLLDRRDEARIADVADSQLVDPSVVSRQLASLEKGGLVRRRPDPADRRAALVSITEEGRAALAAARDRREGRVSAALTDWPAAELADLADKLRRIGDVIERAHHGSAEGTERAESTERADGESTAVPA